MPHFDAFLFNKKGMRRDMTLILDEDDGILESIKSGMKQHGVNEVKIEGIDGTIKDAVINFFERNNFRSAVLKNEPVMLASGNYKLSFDDLYGTMKVATSGKPPMHGTLVRGRAANGLTLRLSFVEYIDK